MSTRELNALFDDLVLRALHEYGTSHHIADLGYFVRGVEIQEFVHRLRPSEAEADGDTQVFGAIHRLLRKKHINLRVAHSGAVTILTLEAGVA